MSALCADGFSHHLLPSLLPTFSCHDLLNQSTLVDSHALSSPRSHPLSLGHFDPFFFCPFSDSFDTGWKQLTQTADTSSLPQAPQHYFRLKRSWLAP